MKHHSGREARELAIRNNYDAACIRKIQSSTCALYLTVSPLLALNVDYPLQNVSENRFRFPRTRASLSSTRRDQASTDTARHPLGLRSRTHSRQRSRQGK